MYICEIYITIINTTTRAVQPALGQLFHVPNPTDRRVRGRWRMDQRSAASGAEEWQAHPGRHVFALKELCFFHLRWMI